MTEEKKIQPDYRHLSYNEMVTLITALYKEVDRMTAERDASRHALDSLSHNVQIGSYSISQIKDTVSKTVEQTIIELRKVRKSAKPVRKKK